MSSRLAGRCDFSNGTCHCYFEPFTGLVLPQPACAMTACPLGALTGTPCNGKGDCNFMTGECKCTALATGGKACDELVCLNDCWSQGSCNTLTGVCTCYKGWTAIDCGTEATSGPTASPTALGRRRLALALGKGEGHASTSAAIMRVTVTAGTAEVVSVSAASGRHRT